MPYLIDNADGTKDDLNQSVFNGVDTDILAAGISGPDCVLEGCVVSATAFPNNTRVDVTSGSVLTNGALKGVASVSGASGLQPAAPDASLARIDLVVVNSSGALAIRSGTAAAIPLMPALTANDVALSALLVPSDPDGILASLDAANLSDKRVIKNGPTTIYKTIAAETTNNTASAIDLLNKSGSGVVIPKGMMTVGRVLHCRMGGNWLHNTAASTTLKLDIILGGTTLYSATSGTAVRTINVRAAWYLTFDIMYQGSSDMTINGKMYSSEISGKAAPTTGIGTGWTTAACVWPFSGGSATPTNGADRTLQVQMTFSGTASASKEIVTEYAVLRLE